MVRRHGVWIAGIVALAGCFAFCGAAKTKDPPWVAKDWTQWNEDDCDAVLNKSPWGQSSQSSGFVETDEILVQLRSSLPIREALLRQLQLENHFDKLGSDKKREFRQAHSHDLDPTGQFAVYIRNASVQSFPSAAEGRLDPAESAPPARQAALRLHDGTLVLPIHASQVKYTPDKVDYTQNQIEYAFPHMVDGKPLLSSIDLSLVIELGARLQIKGNVVSFDQPLPFLDSGKGYTFKTKDLMYKGKLEY